MWEREGREGKGGHRCCFLGYGETWLPVHYRFLALIGYGRGCDPFSTAVVQQELGSLSLATQTLDFATDFLHSETARGGRPGTARHVMTCACSIGYHVGILFSRLACMVVVYR
jgi:hypothetical protein